VVEDDTLILMELEDILHEAGAQIVGPCRSVREALPLARANNVDAAILDFGLGSETAEPIARCLAERGTPFLFYTGQVETGAELKEWRQRKILQKPAQPQAIVAAVMSLLAPAR
jgi:DNA-binding response OmpR family regulator